VKFVRMLSILRIPPVRGPARSNTMDCKN
jgi:hypothetical protein